MEKRSLFEKIMMEAPGDAPPDMPPTDTSPPTMEEPMDAPPETPVEDSMDNGPPDMSMDDAPPELSEDDYGDANPEDGEGEEGEEEQEKDPNEDLGFGEKVSAIMNMNLYQRYLALLNTIGSQISMMKDNSDILYSVSNDSLDVVTSIKKLDENIRIYLKSYFLNEDYSKNLLFFNKCLNLLKMLNQVFESKISRGVKATE